MSQTPENGNPKSDLKEKTGQKFLTSRRGPEWSNWIKFVRLLRELSELLEQLIELL